MNVSAKSYERQMRQMVANGRCWLVAHPGADVKIQWNFPPKVAAIAAISEAVKKGVVSANEDGLALMKALWTWDDASEPTV